MTGTTKTLVARLGVLALGLVLWFLPVPEGLTAPAWHLFAIFAATIASVIAGAFPILTASVLAVAVAVLSGVLTPAKAYAGFANATILLIVVAFLLARAVVKCGLGQRLGYLVVSLFGRSTLGLGYSVFSTPSSRRPSRATRRAAASSTPSPSRWPREAGRSRTRQPGSGWGPT